MSTVLLMQLFPNEMKTEKRNFLQYSCDESSMCYTLCVHVFKFAAFTFCI